MRFAGKLALVATLAAALVGSVFGAPLDISVITKEAAPDTLSFGGRSVVFKAGEAERFLAAITAEKGGVAFEVTPHGGYGAIDNPGVAVTVTLVNGRILSITPAEVVGQAAKATFTINAFGAAATSSPSKTSGIQSASVDTNTADTVLFTLPIKDNMSKVVSLQASVVTAIAKVIQAGGGFLSMVSNDAHIWKADTINSNTKAMGTESAIAIATPFHACYILDDIGTALCFGKPANSDNVTVTMRPKKEGFLSKPWGRFRDNLGGISTVFVTTLGLSVAASHLLYYIDPAGYSLGKRLSSLPEGFKYFLARGDDDTIENGYYGEEEQADVLRLDPVTGRTIRVTRTKDGSIVSTDEPSSPSEPADALSTSVVAVFLLALFF